MKSSVIRESLLTNTRNKWQLEKFSKSLNKSQNNAIRKILISVLSKFKEKYLKLNFQSHIPINSTFNDILQDLSNLGIKRSFHCQSQWF